MKVTGPNGGPGAPPPDALDTAGGPRGTEDAGKAEAKAKAGTAEPAVADRPGGSGQVFAERLAGAGAPAGTPTANAMAHPTAAMARIAADLDAGRLAPRAAVERLVEEVLSRQVGADAPAELRDRVRAALQDALENDPLLGEKLRQLGG